ncbi:MAG: T9SS type A sorting domain-containing protein, partial [candidate division WOR-3 bacterium]
PFSKLTTVSFGIEHSAERIGLCIYDATGRLVKSFDQVSSIQNQASSVLWDGRDDNGRQLAGGVYFVKLEAGDLSATEKVLLVK